MTDMGPLVKTGVKPLSTIRAAGTTRHPVFSRQGPPPGSLVATAAGSALSEEPVPVRA
jgi:hypothetical protein